MGSVARYRSSLKHPKLSARDPQTGQFVSVDSGGNVPGYDGSQLEVLHYRGTFRDNGIGNNDAYTLQDIAELEPAGGIGRSESAELLGLHVHEARAEVDQLGSPGTDGEAVRAGFEISRDEDPSALTQNRVQVDLSGNAFEGDSPSSNVLSRQVEVDDQDLLWFTLGRAERVADSTPDITGTHLYSHGPEHINFRDLAAVGPVFEASDDLHIHGRVNAVDLTNNWVADLLFTTVWKVDEIE